MWRSLAALDAYRRRFEDTPDTLTNAILLGSLLVPLGYRLPAAAGRARRRRQAQEGTALSLGLLPLARRDVERLRQILSLQRRLIDMHLSPRARKALMHRGPFREALTWLEIHGHAPEVVEHWRGFIEAAKTFEAERGARPKRRRRAQAAAPPAAPTVPTP